MTTAYPLAWPQGWPRTKHRDTGNRFTESDTRYYGEGINRTAYRTQKPVSFEKARRKLAAELERMGARSVVLSTNLPLRLDGAPYAGAAGKRMDDPGVAIYFQYKDRPMVMACDRYTDIAANIRSLGLAIEAIRQLDRHGGGTMMEKAFQGFAALPPPMQAQRPWRQVFKYYDGEIVTAASVEQTFRAMAKECHPDINGGDGSRMSELNAARAEALREIGSL